MWDRVGRRVASLAKHFAKSPSGATAVEFALVALPFFYVLGCICETGLMLFTEYVIQNAVQDSARQIRTGQVTESTGTLKTGVTAATFKTDLCKNVSSLINCASFVTVYVNSAASFATLKTTIADPLNVGQKSDGTYPATVFTPGAAKQAVGLIATYDWQFAFPFMSFLGNVMNNTKRRIYGIAMFRNEPF